MGRLWTHARQPLAALGAAFAVVALAGCQEAPPVAAVRLTTEGPAGPGSPAPRRAPVRIAVAPVLSPRESFRLYASLLDYVAAKLDRPVQLLQRPTYSEINDLVRYGHADAAFVCDYAYILGQRDFGMELLVVPRIMGRLTYQSLLIVPMSSPARSLDDLRGRSFAFSDPLSSSGWLYPAYLLRRRGERPETFFARTVFTYGHDNTVRAVADRFVDGGAVDSLVYEFMAARTPGLASRLRIIGRSPAWGNPPVVIHPRLDPALRERLREIFLGMGDDPEARPLLRELMIDGFVRLDDAYYADVRRMAAAVRP